LGWVPDGARIRPVYGIPAAAAVGAPIPADQDFAQIAASPARNYILVSAADGGTVSIYTTGHGLVALDGAGSAPDFVVLSPRGSSAALWFSSIHQVQVVTGLPDAPTIRQLDASLLGSAPAALAVSDDGTWLAGAGPGDLYAFGPNGEVNRLPVENPTALAFFQGTYNLAAAGASGLQTVTGIGGFAVVSNLLAPADSSQPMPVAVAATPDNRTLVLADQSGSVTTIDIASGAATTSDCGCRPQGLFGMGPSAFRLTGLESGAFKLFDAASGEILFVPLALTEAEGAGQ
jgi:DNA-binding beta-propeller fold protein YncE